MEYIKCLIQLNLERMDFIQTGRKHTLMALLWDVRQIGNTQLICQSLVDSSILNMKTQPNSNNTTNTGNSTLVWVFLLIIDYVFFIHNHIHLSPPPKFFVYIYVK